MKHVPQLACTEITTATAYWMSPVNRDFGWAICTVNDQTGELHVQSDWGNWAYRWSPHPAHLGAPTLTHFIARSSGCNYLADKLWGRGYGGQRFSSEKSVAYFRSKLATRRLEEGRRASAKRDVLTESRAREIWEDLGGDLSDCRSEELFVERLYKIDGHEWLGEELWDELKHETDPAYDVLLHGILPVLVAECQKMIESRSIGVSA